MKISVFGMGYVGAVTAGCLARNGHEVVGVDVNPTKVEMINAGQAPVIEEGLPELIATQVAEGRLRATDDAEAAVRATELSLVCVGTPSVANGSLNLGHVGAVAEQIGRALRGKDDFHVVVIRSTVLPGTVDGTVRETLEEASGKRAGVGFGLAMNPEFLREGTSISDFDQPPKTVIGASDGRTAERVAALYETLEAPLFQTSLAVAEMVKYSDNAFHALKVAFANEIGRICKALGIDSHAVMDIFREDRKLNIAPTYLRPGFAFGGSCLPKDLRALTYHARLHDVRAPVLDAILPSNEEHVLTALQRILDLGKKQIGLLGLSFKAGTDDLRESPNVELVERLIGKGYEVRIYDENVSLARLVGANRDYILHHIPHVSNLLVDDLDALLRDAEVVVIGNAAPRFRDAVAGLPAGKTVIDLVHLAPGPTDGATYDGLCW